MNRTFTPTLPPGVLPRLEAYADLFRPDFPLARQADWSLVYLRGLLQDGERKSIEPLAQRWARRTDFDVADPIDFPHIFALDERAHHRIS